MKLPDLKSVRQMFAGHILEPVTLGRHLSAYYLRRPRPAGLSESTLIVFTPEAIVLAGDVTPGPNGTVSSRGYGAAWFAGASSQSYLCEKFLAKRWVPELAAEELADGWFNHFDGDVAKVAELRSLASQVEENTAEWLRDELDDLGADTSTGIPGWGYDPREAAVLIAIQERFAALYDPALFAEPAAATAGNGEVACG